MCGHSQREVFPSQSKEILLSLPYLHSRHLTTGTASMVGSASSTGFPSASTSLIARPPYPYECRSWGSSSTLAHNYHKHYKRRNNTIPYPLARNSISHASPPQRQRRGQQIERPDTFLQPAHRNHHTQDF